jgi:hypothetical protein
MLKLSKVWLTALQFLRAPGLPAKKGKAVVIYNKDLILN